MRADLLAVKVLDAPAMKGAVATGLLEFGRVLHAEMAALTDAARRGVSTQDTTLFCTTFPCHMCARLIIASGVKRVVFIEPYPKSKTKDLYSDSVTVDEIDGDKSKVNFEAFVGVAPRRYEELFSSEDIRRKVDGKAVIWNYQNASPRFDRYQLSYLLFEQEVVANSISSLESANLSWDDSSWN